MRFKFKGGVRTEDHHHTEKFLLFLVSDGEEVPFFSALRQGLITNDPSAGRDAYQSRIAHVKVFCFQSRFGQGKAQYSFVVRLDPDGADIEIKGFGLGRDGYIFQAQGELLKKSDALCLFKAGGTTHTLMSRQAPLPKVLRQQMRRVTYRESDKTPVRKIRVG